MQMISAGINFVISSTRRRGLSISVTRHWPVEISAVEIPKHPSMQTIDMM